MLRVTFTKLRLLKNLMTALTTAYSFFKLLFPDNMIHSIVDHTNSYAQEKIFSGLRSSYTISDGSLQDVTADEI